MIEYIEIQRFKSIKALELEMQPINILIGSNGAGKSNFISFFKLINAIFNERLQRFVAKEKADNLLYFGRKKSDFIFGKLVFSDDDHANNAYTFKLAQTREGGLFLEFEGSGFKVSYDDDYHNYFYNTDLDESKYATDTKYKRNKILQDYISTLQVFHFHDTSDTSHLRSECDINDNRYLKKDGRNLPAFLFYLKTKHPKTFIRIEKTIQTIAPYFQKFILEPNRLDETRIELRWIDTGDPDSSFSAYQLSDGTLRFIALATLLMQPNPPSIIVIDEPELGLHPFAIGKLAGMIQVASSTAQIIVATQSPGLLNHFSPEDIIVMDRDDKESQTVFKRLDSDSLKSWFETYTLGEMWERNIINAAQPFKK